MDKGHRTGRSWLVSAYCVILFLSVSLRAQPILRQWFTTNSASFIVAPANGWFLVWSNPVPVWSINGGMLTNLSQVNPTNNDIVVSNGLFTVIQSATNIALMQATNNDTVVSNGVITFTINATNQILVNATNNDTVVSNGVVTFTVNATNGLNTAFVAQIQSATNLALIRATNNDTVVSNGVITFAVNATNNILANATNNDIVVSNGVVAHTVTVAGTANQITSSVGTAQTLASNPSTTLSLPSPTIFPGQISATGMTNTGFAANGVVTNDSNGKLLTTTTLPNSLLANSSLTIAGTANQISVSGGGPVSLGGTATVSLPNNVSVTSSITNGGLTASTVVSADANKKEVSIANGTGALTNDNAGNFGWFNNFVAKTTNTIYVCSGNGNPSASSTYFFGNISQNFITASATHWDYYQIACPATGTIIQANIHAFVGGTLASAGTVTMTITNITAGTTASLTGIGLTAVTQDASTTGLSMAVTKGDFIAVKLVTPAWSPNTPTSVAWGGTIGYTQP